MISFGFYGSVKHDRRYDANQFGSIFDGIIRNGIFMSIGTCFRVIPSDGMMVIVGPGRAWFDHTWTLNDAPLPLYIPQSEILLDRIDAIVLDIDARLESRKNDVIVIKGTPSKTPQRPTLIKNSSRHQYPLAYVLVKSGSTSIRPADITSMVGTSDTPYVTGILETVNIDALLDQWRDQWNVFFEKQNLDSKEIMDLWKEGMDQWASQYKEALDETAAEWNAWFENAKDVLTKTENGELLEAVMQQYIDKYETDIRPLQELIGTTDISSIEDGTVTGAIKKLDANSDVIDRLKNGAASTLIGNNLTANRALVSGSTGKVTVSSITSTELGYLGSARSNVQTQIDTLSKKKQDAETAITVNNIGQQSVAYAATANTANSANTADHANTANSATDNTKMPINGGNFNGPIGLKNATWNSCGDDCLFGDMNTSGCMAFKSRTGDLTGIALIGAGTDNMYGRLLIAHNGRDMYLTTNGRFFISNGTNSARADIVAAAFVEGSSRRAKTNVKPMTEEEARKTLLLSPVSFDYIDEDMPNGCYGLIAEDTEPVIPSCVRGDVNCPDDDLDAIDNIGIDYSKIVPYLIKMVQLQEKRISDLEKGTC